MSSSAISATSTLAHAKLIDLPRRGDGRGELGFVEAGRQIPFEIKRVYYMYALQPGVTRGAHAHRELEQLIIAGAGSFSVTLNDGIESKCFELNDPGVGLYVPKMLWRELTDFSPTSLCLVLASNFYDESDYYRDFDEFRGARGMS